MKPERKQTTGMFWNGDDINNEPKGNLSHFMTLLIIMKDKSIFFTLHFTLHYVLQLVEMALSKNVFSLDSRVLFWKLGIKEDNVSYTDNFFIC